MLGFRLLTVPVCAVYVLCATAERVWVEAAKEVLPPDGPDGDSEEYYYDSREGDGSEATTRITPEDAERKRTARPPGFGPPRSALPKVVERLSHHPLAFQPELAAPAAPPFAHSGSVFHHDASRHQNSGVFVPDSSDSKASPEGAVFPRRFAPSIPFHAQK